MNLKVMSALIPGLRYSSHPAPAPEGVRPLTVGPGPQTPRRQDGLMSSRGVSYRDGLRPARTHPTPLQAPPLIGDDLHPDTGHPPVR